MRPSLPASLTMTLVLAVRCALGQAPPPQAVPGRPPGPPAPAASPAAPMAAPPAVKAPPHLVAAHLADNQLELRDADTGSPILVRRSAPMVIGQGTGITYAVKMTDRPDGVDLVFNFINTSDRAGPLGTITLGTFTLGRSVTYQDLHEACLPVEVDYNSFRPKFWSYPGELYSPVWVLSDSRYAIGVSLHYPVLEYKHDVRLGLASPLPEKIDSEGGRGWVTTFQLSDPTTPAGPAGGPPKMKYPAVLQPGEVRTYTVSIRVTNNPGQWVRTLSPYRDFFRDTYGPVRYPRRTDAVQAVVMADDSRVSDASPRGFVDAFRPDLLGWGRLSKFLRTEVGDFNRAVLMNPTGLYRLHREFNPPFQMATAWADIPALATASDRYDGLPAIATAGKDMGLWWGNSCRVGTSWDPAGTQALNPFDPEHERLANLEVEAAVRAGITTVVLGNFRHDITPLWALHAWLSQLTARFPDVRFVTEPAACDLLHGVAPTFVKGWNDTTPARREADLYTIKNPHLVADFLLPGHETWAGFTYDSPKQPLKVLADPARVRADMERYAAMGYVPCFFWNGTLEGTVVAAASWEASVPPDLRNNDAPPEITPVPPTAQPLAGGSKPPDKSAPGTVPQGSVLQRPGSRVTVRAAPGTVATHPNEGEVRPETDAVIAALRRAGRTSPAATKTTNKKGLTKVLPSEPEPKKPDDGPK